MTRKGFTLIELLVVIVIIGILVAIALPNFIKIKDKAKEAEVKQNLHAIQLALERYCVDSDASQYPMVVMGGDWTDSITVWMSWRTTQNLNFDGVNPTKANAWSAAPQHRGDTLIMEAYMPSYPQNPFNKQGGASLLPTIQHNNLFGGLITRYVGGRESNKMYEVFGPTMNFASNYSMPNGDDFVHHIFQPYTDTDRLKTPTSATPWRSPTGNKRLTGNFSYYPRNSSYLSFPYNGGAGGVLGYTVAGYGAMRTAGQDVYNRNGNYIGRFRTMPCHLSCIYGGAGDFTGGPGCLCGSTAPPSITRNDGGSDTIIDGVVITLDSGVDKSSKRTNTDTTEGV